MMTGRQGFRRCDEGRLSFRFIAWSWSRGLCLGLRCGNNLRIVLDFWSKLGWTKLGLNGEVVGRSSFNRNFFSRSCFERDAFNRRSRWDCGDWRGQFYFGNLRRFRETVFVLRFESSKDELCQKLKADYIAAVETKGFCGE